MEHNVDLARCETYGRIIESYIRLLAASGGDEERIPIQDSVITDILSYIEDNISGDLSVRTIAELFHYNEKCIGRLFKQMLGCSVRMYICSRRVERAMTLLRKSEDSVTDIATRMGFENVTYFNRRFRQLTGMTPTQYRVTVKNGGSVSCTVTQMSKLDELYRVFDGMV